MNRILVLATTACIAIAGSASAMSFQVNFPTLTYPPQPMPETSQACTDLTTMNGDTCTATSK